MVSLPFTLYVTVTHHVSVVIVSIRDGPHVEGIQTRQLDAIQGSYRHSGMAFLASLPWLAFMSTRATYTELSTLTPPVYYTVVG